MTNRIASFTASCAQSNNGSVGASESDLHRSSSAADLLTILAAHWRLGINPSGKLLVAAGPFLAARAQHLSLPESQAAQQMMTDFEFEFERYGIVFVLYDCGSS
jgi:hypothetical protein